LLRRVATLVEGNAEELAGIESRNLGKPISGARGEIGRSRTSSISTRTRRPLGKPREIVNAALFLGRDESSFVNGAAFVVDGETLVGSGFSLTRS